MKTLSIVLLMIMVGCGSSPSFEKEKVEEVLLQQAEAWNRGDIDGYMEGYWKNDSLRFVTSKKVTYGWLNVKERYKKAYPDKKAMGKLEFDLLHVDPIEKEHAQVTGKWTLYRDADTLGGHFLLLMKNFDGDWKIIVDATS